MKTTAFILIFLPFLSVYAQMPKVGVFYFDGWTQNQWDNYSIHSFQGGAYNDDLVHHFPERQPAYGWITSTEKGIEQQIDDAAEAGIDFFIFDWYYCDKVGYKDCFLNNALRLFMKASNKDKVGFVSMITNDTYDIGPNEWQLTIDELIHQFSNSSYYYINNKPLLLIYNGNRMIKKFGNVRKFNKALQKLKEEVIAQGMQEPLIGVMNISEERFRRSKHVDFITSYNDPTAAWRVYPGTTQDHFSLDDLQKGEQLGWKQLADQISKKKFFVPTVTAGWDTSPWNKDKKASLHLFYETQTIESVKKAVLSADQFNHSYKTNNTNHLIFVNSWNEYGEGSYISRMNNGDFFGLGIKEAKKHLQGKKSN